MRWAVEDVGVARAKVWRRGQRCGGEGKGVGRRVRTKGGAVESDPKHCRNLGQNRGRGHCREGPDECEVAHAHQWHKRLQQRAAAAVAAATARTQRRGGAWSGDGRRG
eukprot:1154557-Prymnesium_polylepis.1